MFLTSSWIAFDPLLRRPQTTGADQPSRSIATMSYVVGRKKSDPVAAVANLCDEWAQHGFIILLVVDGTRPVVK